jgi:hypothetical protein
MQIIIATIGCDCLNSKLWLQLFLETHNLSILHLIFMYKCIIWYKGLVSAVRSIGPLPASANYSRFQKSLPQPLFPKKGVIGPPNTFVSYLAHSLTDLPDSWCVHVISSTLRCRPLQWHQTTAFFCCCKSHCSLTCCHLLRKTCMLYGLDMGWGRRP